MFERKGEFQITLNDDNVDEVELALIDCGLDLLEKNEEENSYTAYSKYEDFGALALGLENLNIEVKSAKLVRIPTSPITLTEEQMQELDKLLDKIEDDDDVQAVYTNLA